jgi:hypothetical protein
MLYTTRCLVLSSTVIILTGMSDKTYTEDDLRRVAGMFSEQVKDELQIIHEVLGDIQLKVAHLPTRDEFNELKADIHTVKATAKDTNRELHTITRPGYVAEEPSSDD